MFEDIKKIVEKNYDIKVDNIKKVKNVYNIESDNKYFALKVIKYEFPHFLFIYKAMKHLQSNGYNKIPEFIPTKDGKEYIEVFNNYAYLNPWMDARESNYDNFFDIYKSTINLAELHKKSEGFIVTEDMKPRIGWLKWIETFKTRKDEIFDFKRRIDKKPKKSEFDIEYEAIMEGELKRCDESLNILKNSLYEELMKKEMRKNGFCHHDYANHNILIGRDEDIYLIDFDYCILDTHLHDLCSLLIRRMKDGKWSIYNALDILKVYGEIYPIYKEEIPVMAGFMNFPQIYWQLGIQYYWEEQPWNEEFFLKKLRKYILDIEQKEEFIKKFEKLNVFN
ncbi:CotS family spore coat protein [Hathewaya massiliensis]|uniref:CotS family spore coat protein n=1 Tax=Hathewaya massiliensis TaxID=1964382 RepID=UPI00115B9A0E|nr:CotS family spore coat protein [Hathewaya massiliensis]